MTKSNPQPIRRRELLRGLITGLLAPGLVVSGYAQAQDPNAEFWRLAQQGGNIILVRHTRTHPGIGDPAGFELNDCTTQRTLNDQGRSEARRIGELFNQAGVSLDRVRSSAWCRCTETAHLAFGHHEIWPPINSIFNDRSRGPSQTQTILQAAAQQPANENWGLVTHRSNILLLTREETVMGDVLLTRFDPNRPNQLHVLAKLVR